MKIFGGMAFLHGPNFGVWKQPTGKKRCKAAITGCDPLVCRPLLGRRCFRQEGHTGNHGWDMLSGRLA